MLSGLLSGYCSRQPIHGFTLLLLLSATFTIGLSLSGKDPFIATWYECAIFAIILMKFQMWTRVWIRMPFGFCPLMVGIVPSNCMVSNPAMSIESRYPFLLVPPRASGVENIGR